MSQRLVYDNLINFRDCGIQSGSLFIVWVPLGFLIRFICIFIVACSKNRNQRTAEVYLKRFSSIFLFFVVGYCAVFCSS